MQALVGHMLARASLGIFLPIKWEYFVGFMGNLALLSDIKTLLQISDNSQDALLNIILSGVSAQIESYCSRIFGVNTAYVEIKAANNRQLLLMDQWPINSITSITQSGTLMVAGTDYQLYPQFLAAGQIYRGIGWTGPFWTRGLTSDPYTGELIYNVTYSAGYVLPGDIAITGVLDLPKDIQMACQLMTAKVYNLATQGNLGENLSSIREGGLAYSWDNPAKLPSDLFSLIAGMPVQFATLLQPYRRAVAV